MAPRLRRVEMVERNREAVLAAARRIFIARGYAGATLEAIAEEAGFSTGVMYSQFDSKADLFLSLLERRIQERQEQSERVVAEYAGLKGLLKLLELGSEDAVTEAAWSRVVVEFRALASRDPSLNTRYAVAHGRGLEGTASVLERLFAKAELRPHFPPRVMAELLMALVSGLALERAANPASLPIEAVVRMVPGALGFTEPDVTSPSAPDPRVPQRRGLNDRRNRDGSDDRHGL